MAWEVDDSLRSADLDMLDVRFLPLASGLVTMCGELGLPFQVWETRRDHRRQAAYFNQGRAMLAGESRVDTKAEPGESPHEWGFAIDLVLNIPGVNPWAGLSKAKSKRADRRKYQPLWAQMADCARELGLTSGYHSWGWDWPHSQQKLWTQHRPRDWRASVRYRLEEGIPGD